MGEIRPTQKQIELYNKMREIAEPHHMYQNQIMAIAEWIDVEFTHNSQANEATKNESGLPLQRVMPMLLEITRALDDAVEFLSKVDDPTVLNEVVKIVEFVRGIYEDNSMMLSN